MDMDDGHDDPFQSWLDACLLRDGTPSSGSDQLPPRDENDASSPLRREARLHFEALASSARSAATPAAPSADGALTLLVSILGPALASAAPASARRRALCCVAGALEGSDGASHGVRDSVGRFLAAAAAAAKLAIDTWR